MSKKPKESMTSYIVKLKNHTHRLQALGEFIADSMIINKILMTLPTSYNHFITVWESIPRVECTLANLVERFLAKETRYSAQVKILDEAFAAIKMARKKNQKGK